MKSESPDNFLTSRKKKEDGRLLLLCQGNTKIVFAHGDSSLLNLKLSQLKDQPLFSLGFTRYSLLKIEKKAEEGLLEPPYTTRRFTLERVKSEYSVGTRQQFQASKSQYLFAVDFKCSLVKVKLGDKPPTPLTVKVRRQVHNLLTISNGQIFLALVEVIRSSKDRLFKTSFEDYRRTLDSLNNRDISPKEHYQ